MGKPSRGVVAVGGLSTGHARVGRPRPVPSADGSALLSAVGAWLVGVEPAVCAVIGADFPSDLIRTITRAGIDLSRVQLAPAGEGPSDDLEPYPEQVASVGPNWAVHVCGMSTLRQRAIIRAVNQRVALVSVDTVYRPARIEPDRKEVLALAADSDAFLSGRSEVTHLWPGEPPREVLRHVARAGARAAIIKLGLGGSIGIREGSITWMPAFPVTASGVTCGGDAYAGAFAAMFAVDRNLSRAMAWAAAAASVVVESSDTLDVLTDYARRKVESRARTLTAELKPGK